MGTYLVDQIFYIISEYCAIYKITFSTILFSCLPSTSNIDGQFWITEAKVPKFADPIKPNMASPWKKIIKLNEKKIDRSIYLNVDARQNFVR